MLDIENLFEVQPPSLTLSKGVTFKLVGTYSIQHPFINTYKSYQFRTEWLIQEWDPSITCAQFLEGFCTHCLLKIIIPLQSSQARWNNLSLSVDYYGKNTTIRYPITAIQGRNQDAGSYRFKIDMTSDLKPRSKYSIQLYGIPDTIANSDRSQNRTIHKKLSLLEMLFTKELKIPIKDRSQVYKNPILDLGMDNPEEVGYDGEPAEGTDKTPNAYTSKEDIQQRIKELESLMNQDLENPNGPGPQLDTYTDEIKELTKAYEELQLDQNEKKKGTDSEPNKVSTETKRSKKNSSKHTNKNNDAFVIVRFIKTIRETQVTKKIIRKKDTEEPSAEAGSFDASDIESKKNTGKSTDKSTDSKKQLDKIVESKKVVNKKIFFSHAAIARIQRL